MCAGLCAVAAPSCPAYWSPVPVQAATPTSQASRKAFFDDLTALVSKMRMRVGAGI
jgi:hypothetical protein